MDVCPDVARSLKCCTESMSFRTRTSDVLHFVSNGGKPVSLQRCYWVIVYINVPAVRQTRTHRRHCDNSLKPALWVYHCVSRNQRQRWPAGKQATGAHHWFQQVQIKTHLLLSLLKLAAENRLCLHQRDQNLKILKLSRCYVVSWTNTLCFNFTGYGGEWERREMANTLEKTHADTHVYKRSGGPRRGVSEEKGWHMASRPLHWVGQGVFVCEGGAVEWSDWGCR